ncbi:MAG TPA: YdcF family protein [Patescibacteria group bacterium]|nr:YdcF family protein [Patescibacteria group bacterium]
MSSYPLFRRRRSFPARVLRALVLGIALVLLALEVPIIGYGYLSTPQPSQVMIVLGSRVIGQEPGPMLTPRLQEALRLYRQGYAPLIIVSGARGADEAASEAAVMKEYLVREGVPAASIIPEDQSFSTRENLVNSQRIMAREGLTQALIVSNRSHICRSLLLAHRLGLSASAAPAPMAPGWYRTFQQYTREGAALAYQLLFNR